MKPIQTHIEYYDLRTGDTVKTTANRNIMWWRDHQTITEKECEALHTAPNNSIYLPSGTTIVITKAPRDCEFTHFSMPGKTLGFDYFPSEYYSKSWKRNKFNNYDIAGVFKVKVDNMTVALNGTVGRWRLARARMVLVEKINKCLQ